MTDTIKHVISFSGGMGSFAEALSCVTRYGKDNVHLVFADTLMEDEDLYRFIDECVQYLDCEYTVISAGLTPWQLFEQHKFVANSRVDLCSRILKRELINKFIGDKYRTLNEVVVTGSSGADIVQRTWGISCEVHIGIDFSEHHRLLTTQDRMKPWVYRSTLVEDGRIIPKDYSEQFGIRKPRLYAMGFGHNNCGGFCVKAGLGHFKTLYEKMPERYFEHEAKEIELANKYGTLPFLKKTIKGTTIYLTMKQYREQYLEQGLASEDTHDIGGCACAL